VLPPLTQPQPQTGAVSCIHGVARPARRDARASSETMLVSATELL